MLVLGVDCAIVMSTPSEGLEERDAVRISVEQSPDVATECHDSRETQLGGVMANESPLYTERRTQNAEHRTREDACTISSESLTRLEMRGCTVPFKLSRNNSRSISPCNCVGATWLAL